MSSDRQGSDAVRDVLDTLVQDGTLTAAQARRVETDLRAAHVGTPAISGGETESDGLERRERLVEILSYLGGALVLGALALIVGLAWDDLGKAAKLAICGGTSLLLLGAAAVVAWPGAGGRNRRRTLASTLAAVASAGAALTTGVAIETGDLRDLIAPGLVMTAVAVACYVGWRAAPLVCAVFAGGFLAVIGVLAALPDSWRVPVVIGAGILIYGAAWLVVAGLRLVSELAVAEILGGATTFLGAEIACADDDYAVIGLVLGLGVIAAMFALFWATRHWWYAALGAVSALVIPPTALGVIWGNSLLVGIVLLAIGVALIVGAVVTVRRRRGGAVSRDGTS